MVTSVPVHPPVCLRHDVGLDNRSPFRKREFVSRLESVGLETLANGRCPWALSLVLRSRRPALCR